ncbi:acyl CoA binding protein-domain-containing protein [Rhodotorula diobovata]|uniref:Acyl CoA binding protein-domain-containing protein n=1 Tax=Rhodotorula diobovata TaxID=5288 RepID=A0A5C5G1P4_9BASI|nr:acyl CoA binding protein-domain-containing protein [Rhodotorula diobovata]
MTSVSSYSTRSRPPPHPLSAHPVWVHARFERAVDIIQSLPKSGPIQTTYDQKLELYSVYKQATEGDIKGSRPGLLDILGRAKWDAWNKRRGTSQLEAERLYVEALIRILRSFSSRTQAVELLHELEDFDLDPPLRGDTGSTPRPRSDSSGSSTSVSTSTASYDARDRRVMPPPAQLQHSMHSAARSSRSHHHRPPPSASAVAPPLPGYGPPRTRADAVRSAPAASQQRQRPPPSERSYSSGSSSSSSRCADDDVFHPAHASVPPSVRSHVRGAVPARVAPPRSVAGSSIAAGAGALPPLTAGNLRAVASRAPSVAAVPLRASTPALARAPPSVATPGPPPTAAAGPLPPPPPPQLDAALERIQLSLTALHERLSLLESSGTGGGLSPSGGTGSTPLALVAETVRRLLEAVHLRRRTSSTSPGSPSIAVRTRTAAQHQRPSFTSLLWRLVAGLLLSARRLAGDACVVLALAVLVGRLRGVDVLGLVARRVLGASGVSVRRVRE